MKHMSITYESNYRKSQMQNKLATSYVSLLAALLFTVAISDSLRIVFEERTAELISLGLLAILAFSGGVRNYNVCILLSWISVSYFILISVILNEHSVANILGQRQWLISGLFGLLLFSDLTERIELHYKFILALMVLGLCITIVFGEYGWDPNRGERLRVGVNIVYFLGIFGANAFIQGVKKRKSLLVVLFGLSLFCISLSWLVFLNKGKLLTTFFLIISFVLIMSSRSKLFAKFSSKLWCLALILMILEATVYVLGEDTLLQSFAYYTDDYNRYYDVAYSRFVSDNILFGSGAVSGDIYFHRFQLWPEDLGVSGVIYQYGVIGFVLYLALYGACRKAIGRSRYYMYCWVLDLSLISLGITNILLQYKMTLIFAVLIALGASNRFVGMNR